MGSLEALDPANDPRWPALVERAPAAVFFHHPAWLRLVSSHFGFRSWVWAVLGSRDELAAGLPIMLLRSRLTGTRLIALPFSESCPPLIAPGAPLTLGAFCAQLDEQRTRHGLDLEIRSALPTGHSAHQGRSFVGHRLALEADLDAVRSRFSKSQVRRGIAKAERDGVAIERRTDLQSLERFYRLHLMTRRRQGLPTPSKRFVLRLSELFADGLGFVLLARQHDRDIAAAVFFTAYGTLTYELGASDHRYLSSRPNNLLFMEAIRWGCETGHHSLDFGRTELDNEGLRRFKRAWGAEEFPMHYSHYSSSGAPAGPPGRLRDALSATIPRAPAIFGRAVGTALYPHLG